jgi:hypothetical protein
MSEQPTATPEPETPAVPAVAATAAVPSTLGSSKLGRGHEEPSEMDELEMPRAKLVQFTSGEAQAEDAADRKAAGILINSITKEELGMIFIPIFKFTNFTRWNPRKKDDPNYDPAFEPGELIFQTDNREDPRVVEASKFGPNGEAPAVTKYMNYLCYFIGSQYPLLLSFSKTSFKAGKKLNSLTQFSGGDMFSYKYKLSVSIKENAGTKFFVLDVIPAGKATAEEFALAEKWYNDFRGKAIKAHQDHDVAGEGFSE